MLEVINDNIKDVQKSVNRVEFHNIIEREKLNERLDNIENTLKEVLNKLDTGKELSKKEKGK